MYRKTWTSKTSLGKTRSIGAIRFLREFASLITLHVSMSDAARNTNAQESMNLAVLRHIREIYRTYKPLLDSLDTLPEREDQNVKA